MRGYCQVTVTGPQRWADLALPDAVPVASLLPQIIRACSPEAEGTQAAGWTLATSEGTAIPLEDSLEKAGVADGTVLLLSKEPPRTRPSHVDDVRGAVEDRVDENSRIWGSATTLAFGLLAGGLGPLAVLGVMSYLHPHPGNLAVAAGGSLFCLALMVLASRRSMTAVAHVLFAAACAWGAAMAALTVLVVTNEPDPLIPAAFACAGALLIATIGWWVDELGLPYLAALGVTTAAGGVLCGVGVVVDAAQGVRSLALLLALGVGALPRTALAMGGLSGLDYEVRHAGQVGTRRFEENFTSSDRLLLGFVVGSTASAAAAVALLVGIGGRPQDALMAALVSLLLVLRSRLFDRVSHVLPLRLAGVLGLGYTAVASLDMFPPIAPWLPTIALATGAALAVVSWVRLAEVPRASLRRVLNGVEIAVVIALCAATAWAMGLFDLVQSLAS
ncbi:type VII secretion integral membrane protein EccD [Haloactinospora alba]|uniref:type VII secretion integral membrane protein EccD n=1 Tax=Haloactinospora alba TaxID=405555 RepID=UPI001152B2B1|nr:type VII secretion integral membrane protein EccD [Haloactinospora alba]